MALSSTFGPINVKVTLHSTKTITKVAGKFAFTKAMVTHQHKYNYGH